MTEQEPSVADQIAAALDKLSDHAARDLGLAEDEPDRGHGREPAPAGKGEAGTSPAGAPLKAALFDVDGTLVDTNYLHTAAWWEAFARAGHDVPMASIHRAIGMGSDRLLDALLPAGRDRAGDDIIKIAHSALYQVYWPQLRPLPGAADLLRACHHAGLRVVLASSADPRELDVLRDALDADDAIDAATSAGDVGSSKPAPDLVHVALEQAGTDPAQTVFVGDSVWDAQACQKAGVPCIGVLSGGTSREELLSAGAVAVYGDPADLLAQFPGSLQAARSPSA
ncbi:MAG TPA: HAD family hydrolase [Streptosporangiaceae bacterium]|nr:HAD family hydrolase [Streptosporangiaceae bacterium]